MDPALPFGIHRLAGKMAITYISGITDYSGNKCQKGDIQEQLGLSGFGDRRSEEVRILILCWHC